MSVEERLVKEMCWGPMWDTHDKCVRGLQGLPENYFTSAVFIRSVIDELIIDSIYEALVSPCMSVRYRANQLYEVLLST